MPIPSHTLKVSSEAIPVFLGAPALEPVRLSGVEGVNSLFAYELLLKTPESLNLVSTITNLDGLCGRSDQAGRWTAEDLPQRP